MPLHPDWKGRGKDEDETAQAILEYLKAQPQAGDTLEGITKWWLMRQRVSQSVEAVQRALNRLRDQGFIHERRLAGGSTLYEASGPEEGENQQDAKSAKKK